ncbi:MAG: hypothetical protein QXH07_07100 [Thermoplasmata archaeon]
MKNKRIVSISIDDDVWTQFRVKVARDVGLDKGAISKTVEALIKEYIASQHHVQQNE